MYRVTRRRRRRRRDEPSHGGECNRHTMDGGSETCDPNAVQRQTLFDLTPLLPHGGERSVGNAAAAPTTTRTENDHAAASPSPSMNVRIDQVLRRHHTNQGRFESWIEIHRSNSSSTLTEVVDDGNHPQFYCELRYRQVFPNFVTPMWRSLKVVEGDADHEGREYTTNKNSNYDDMSSSLTSTVEWKAEDGSSILHVTATTGDGHLDHRNSLPSTLTISLEYTPTFLTMDDFPGDPNRGRELPPAHLTVHCRPGPGLGEWRKGVTVDGDVHLAVYSNSLLLLPPVPDMSMPFNVISLTSSLYAYIVGTIITILVRKASEKIKYKLHPDKRPASKLKQLKDKFRTKVLARLRWPGKSNKGGVDATRVEEVKSDDKQPT